MANNVKRRLNEKNSSAAKRLKQDPRDDSREKFSIPTPPAEPGSEDESDFVGFDQSDSDQQNVGSSHKERNKPLNSVGSSGQSAAEVIDETLKGGLNSSRESHAKQKVLVQERKAAKPYADVIQRAKKIWERLRCKSHVPLQERKVLVEELFDIIIGKVKDFVFKHDAGRVVQCAIKYGNLDRRKAIARELKGNFVELAKGKYSKHLIDKLLVHGDDEITEMIIPEFYGQVRRLLRHPEASWVMDDIYRGAASKTQKAIFLCEFYGPEFSLFQSSLIPETPPSSDLSSILAASPEKRVPTLRFLLTTINQLIQTNRTAFTILHDAMLEYILNVKPGSDELHEFIEVLRTSGDDSETPPDAKFSLLRSLAFDRSGAKTVCLALAHGSAKDRKIIIKAFKDEAGAIIPELAANKAGYLVLLTAFAVIDDTVLTSKTIFPDLVGRDSDTDVQVERIMQLSNQPKSRLVLSSLLQPVSEDDKTWSSTLSLPQDDAVFLSQIFRIRASTSKKSPVSRAAELRAAISPALLNAVSVKAGGLVSQVSSASAKRVVSDILLYADGDKAAAMSAVAELAATRSQSIDDSDEGKNKEDLVDLRDVGQLYKTLVQGGVYSKSEGKVLEVNPPLGFANVFFKTVGRQRIVDWTTSKSSFVVVNMLEARDFHYYDDLIAILQDERQTIIEAARGGNTGAQKLLLKI